MQHWNFEQAGRDLYKFLHPTQEIDMHRDPSEEEISELLVQLETENVMSKFDALIAALKGE